MKIAEFLNQIEIGGPDECWPHMRWWEKIHINPHLRGPAARVMWQLLCDQPLLKGRRLHHECCHKNCCNPKHMRFKGGPVGDYSQASLRALAEWVWREALSGERYGIELICAALDVHAAVGNKEGEDAPEDGDAEGPRLPSQTRA